MKNEMEKNKLIDKQTQTYNEIKDWFDSKRDVKLGMKIHAKYQKNKSKVLDIATNIVNRNNILQKYLLELLNEFKPIDEPKFIPNKKNSVNQNSNNQKVYKESLTDRLKKEFPKLVFNDLPKNLQLLVIERYTAWQKSVDYHAKQHDAQTDEERFEAVKNTISNIKNNWTIWEELEHYQKYNKPIGKHKSFEKNEFEEWVKEQEKKSAAEAALIFSKFRKNCRNNIFKLIKKAEIEPLTENQKEIFNLWIEKHDIVSVKINEKSWEESRNDKDKTNL